ncbi:MAG: cadmium-translocating P-type ATPase [Bacteroidetes bacterium]|nr:cadmium-translocating P-type ATPase [Bacteroidota bacterium]
MGNKLNGHHHHQEPEKKEAAKGQMKHSSHQEHDKEGHSQHHSHSSHEGGHTGHNHADMIGDFKKRFWISLVLSIPIILLSEMIQHWFGFTIAFPGDRYVLAGLSTVVFFYGGWPFLTGLWDEVKSNAIGMMTLIGVAITVAWGYSTAVALGLEGMDFYWEMATLIVIMLFGHWMEMKSISNASKSLELLVKMMPSEANLIKGDEVKKVSVSEISKGDLVLIKPGEKIPVDGKVTEGESHIDESMLTGESKPVKKEKGGKVIGGSINGNGSLKVEVSGSGKDSYLNKVIGLVEEAQKEKSKTQHLANKAAKVLTFVALGGGFITLGVWLYLGFTFVFALERMVTVMVISCPHALGLAVPLVVAISTSISAGKGLLIRNRTAFENSRKITVVVFDKTGTLTKGTHELSKIKSVSEDYSEEELLRLSAAIEQHSEHHIAKGILKKAKERKINIPKSEHFNSLPGVGLEGKVDGKNIIVVGPNYLKDKGIEKPAGTDREAVSTIVYVLMEEEVIGYFTFEDQIREESFETIRILKEQGIENLLLTGDNERVAKKVADELKMDGFFANVLPHQKQEKIKELQQKGQFVAMAGDGVNDAPALAQADVGIAIGSGTDVAAETADIVLVNSNPKDIASLILFGKATHRKMVQNLIWATGYNVIAIPLAAGVLYNQGIVLSPAVGAVLMSLSTIIVAINAQLLKGVLSRES